jgi:tetratricopeptide (TPR) repeat protein
MSVDRRPQLRSMLEESPNEPFLLFALAKEYEKYKEQDTALKYYIKLRDTHPEYIGTYYHLGKLYEQKELFRMAWSTYKEGMQVAQKLNDQHALSELAGAKLALGDDEDFEE